MNRFFFWWRPCGNCGKRKPEFLDGLCFGCNYEKIERAFWTDLLTLLTAIRGLKQ